MPKLEHNLVHFKMTVRNKGLWGDPYSIASTTYTPINAFSTNFSNHNHAIPFHILWIREMWAEFALNDLLCLPFCHPWTLTIGAFPFQLGRGIALGSAYFVLPADLGFYFENAIDQYGFGALLTGEVLKDTLYFDLYTQIIENEADTFANTADQILEQVLNHRQDPERGFGVINYVVAARLRWNPKFDNPKASARIEPYALYNHDPEQTVVILGDAKSDLFTIGLAVESEFDRFNWGFDTAWNMGRQTLYGIDTNMIQVALVNGVAVANNSQVLQAPPGQETTSSSPNALFNNDNQNIIYESPATSLDNGMIIGTNEFGTLLNSTSRFVDPSYNLYRGIMFVFDMGYYFIKPDLLVCGGFGFASGDANPTRDEQFIGDSDFNKVYEGFIGLEESYSGIRIKSAFLLAGSARIPRPLSFPSQSLQEPTVSSISRFSDIVYVGASATWRPSWSCRQWSINPNLIAYWTDYSAPFFDETTVANTTSRFARNYLGTEANAFIEAQMMPELKFFAVVAFFVPGSFYRDSAGRPLDSQQTTFLDNLDITGLTNIRQPLLGYDKAYSATCGFEYIF